MKNNKKYLLFATFLITFNLFSFNCDFKKSEAKEDYKFDINITNNDVFSLSINEEISFSIFSYYDNTPKDLTYSWSLKNDKEETIFICADKEFSYSFSLASIYKVSCFLSSESIGFNSELYKDFSINENPNIDKNVSFNCAENIALLLNGGVFKIEAYIDNLIDNSINYNWVIIDHNVLTFSSSPGENNSVEIKPISKGDTKLILNVNLSKTNLVIISKIINIKVIEEVKTIDAKTDKNYYKPGSDIVIDLLINGEKNVVNYSFSYSLLFNNEEIFDFEKSSNSTLLIKNAKKGNYLLKLNGLNGVIKTYKVNVDNVFFLPIFMSVLPYILSVLVVFLFFYIYVKGKKRKTLSMEDYINNLKFLQKSFTEISWDKLNNIETNKKVNYYYRKTAKTCKNLTFSAEHFVMSETSDAYNLLNKILEISKSINLLSRKGFNKMVNKEKIEVLKIFFTEQLNDLFSISDSFFKNYKEYQEYRSNLQKIDNENDKLATVNFIREFKTHEDYKKYLKIINKSNKENEKSIDK